VCREGHCALKKETERKKKQAEGVIPNRYQRMRVIKLEPQRGRVREEKEEKKKEEGMKRSTVSTRGNTRPT
jgi:hypothetical protein